MDTKKAKTRADSISIMTELVLPNDANILGNLLGGRFLHWIDIAGALTAQRHTNGVVATITMDTVEFRHPVKLGNILILTSYVTWSGNTSVEVAVEAVAENTSTGERQFINKVYVVFVGIGEDGKKRQIPLYKPISANEIKECEEAEERRAKRIALSQSLQAHQNR